MNTSNILISHTGIINGGGTDRFKWVSNLSREEREHVRNGGIVLVEVPEPRHHTQTEYKQVTYYRGKYGHRNYYGKGAR